MSELRKPVWRDRFEIAPGKWVFVPDEETKIFGRDLVCKIRSKWNAPPYYVHLGSKGHVNALRAQLNHTYFARLDLRSFFGSVNKSRITRNLFGLFGDYTIAREAAVMSTVKNLAGDGYVLPFGFVQSTLVASLCLHNSKLGRALSELDGSIQRLVYVDDILISTSGPIETLDRAYEKLRKAAIASRFVINEDKSQASATNSVVFNIEIAHDSMGLTQQRMTKFQEAVRVASNPQTVNSIVSYIASINMNQATLLSPSV